MFRRSTVRSYFTKIIFDSAFFRKYNEINMVMKQFFTVFNIRFIEKFSYRQ